MMRSVRRGTLPRSVLLGVLIAAYFAVTVPLGAVLDVSRDEWYSLRTTSLGLAYAYRTGIGLEALPPVYPLLLDLWRHLHGSIFFARCFSIVTGAGTVLLAWRFAARRRPQTSPVWFAGAVAIAPFALYCALDIRLYALAVLVSTGLLVTFYEGFFDRPPSRGARLAHLLLAALSVWVQYYVAAQLLGECLALVALRRWSALRDYGVQTALAALCWLPLVKIVMGQLSVYNGGPPYRTEVRDVFIAFVSFVLPENWLQSIYHGVPFVLYLAILVACTVSLGLARPHATDELVAQGSIVAGILAFFVVTPLVFHQELILPRHAATLFMPALALGAFALASATHAPRRTGLILGGAYVACALVSLAYEYSPLTKEGDYRRVASYLNVHDPHGTPIYAFDLESVGPLALYYRGSSPLVPVPHAESFARFDTRAFELSSAAAVRASFRGLAPGSEAWLYLGPDCFNRDGSDPYHCSVLRSVIASDFRTLLARRYYNSELLELARR